MKLACVVSVPIEIRSGYLPHTSRKRYAEDSLLRRTPSSSSTRPPSSLCVGVTMTVHVDPSSGYRFISSCSSPTFLS
jgi:hypothetical protein